MQARRKLAEVLSAIEFLDSDCMDVATAYLPGVTNPLAGQGQAAEAGDPRVDKPFYMLVETHGSDASHDQAKLDAFLEVFGACGGGCRHTLITVLRDGPLCVCVCFLGGGGTAFKPVHSFLVQLLPAATGGPLHAWLHGCSWQSHTCAT